uniref:Ribosomal protein S18 n=1 Tax=Lepidodinium chlorophorum TaxID=107758 RepID=A0A0F7R4M1_LEPCH|nr:ribosomal protein S18 [Lepidodinium chlorophorum]BAR72348.1 ribosomal protein S18 [Lepidodinium chlorophorum]
MKIIYNNENKISHKLSSNLHFTICYKHVNLLQKYISNTRKIIPQYNSKLTSKKHRIITKYIHRAQRVRFVPYNNTSSYKRRRKLH